MPSNSQLRNIHFAQGVEITLPVTVLNDSDELDLANNQAALSTGITVDLTTTRELIFDYTIRRRTDLTTGLIERARMRLTANPDGVLQADKWILSWDFQNNEGVTPGVTFTITVAAGIATLKYATTNIAGANHHCYWSYSLTTFLI